MKKSINLYDVYRKQQKIKQSVGTGTTMLVITMILALLIGAVGLRLTLDRNSLRNDNQDMMADITNASKVQKYQEILKLQESVNQLSGIESKIDSVKSILDQKNPITRGMLEDIYSNRPSSVDFEFVSIELPIVVLQVVYTCQSGLTDYIKTLESLDYVEYIESKALSLIEDDAACKTTYQTDITIYLGGNY